MQILKNKKIMISGVGKGLGKEIMLDCLKKGAVVIGFSRTKKDVINIKKMKLKNLKLFCGDVTNSKFLDSMFNFLKKKNIKLDGLVNNAGIRQRKSFMKITKKDLNNIIQTNFTSVFQISQKFLNQVKRDSNSSIVNISSIVGNLGFSELTGYASSKSAVDGLTRSLSLELLEKNLKVRVNCVNPGFTETSYFKKFKKNKKLFSWTIKNIPAKRWAKPNEISELVTFLLSDNSLYITGQTIKIDGGWTK